MGPDGPSPPSKPLEALLGRPGRFRSAVSCVRDVRDRRLAPGRAAVGAPCRLAGSASAQRSACSYPRRARPCPAATAARRGPVGAAVAVAAQGTSRRVIASGACARGRHSRPLSRRRPGCRSSRQVADACGSSRRAGPARTPVILAAILPSRQARLRRPHAVRHAAPLRTVRCDRRSLASPFRLAPRPLPPATGDETAVPNNDGPPAERPALALVITR